MIKQLLTTCWVAILLFTGCAGLKDPDLRKPIPPSLTPSTEIDPGPVMADLRQVNAGMTSFKGLGRIKIWKPDGLQSTRIVWAGYHTDQLRLEILDAGGRPFSSVVYDGRRFYLSLHSERRFFQKETRHADLSRLVSLPVSVRDLLAILAGRVPLLEDAQPKIEKVPPGNQYVLLLTNGWLKKQTAKIYLREDMKTVWKYELYQGKNRLLYRVEFLGFKEYGDYRLPNTLLFSNGSQTRIRIDVDKIWPDAKLPASVFILQPPGN